MIRPHAEAIARIKGKPAVTREVFDRLLPELRGRVFTITGLEGVRTLERARDLIAGLPAGQTWDDAKEGLVAELSPFLSTEPTGEDGTGPSAAERRAELLLRTHGFQAFNAANWRVAQEDADTTHLQYLATEDLNTRDSHLALNGLILPKDDPFWDTHTPPWEWGCRCRIRPINPDLLAEAKEADASREPDQQLVPEGPMLAKLREGTLVRDGRTYDITPAQDRRSERPYRWHPDDLRLSLAELRAATDPADWATFEAYARRTTLDSGQTLWNWLGQAK